MSASGYLATPWPGEDGGPQRLQIPRSGAALGLRAGEKLGCISRRTWMSTMTLLGAPGEVYLLTHSALRARLGLPTTACVERIDAQSLKTLDRSPRLAGGPMWPGGMALHRNGDIYVVYGRYLHRLDRACQPRAKLRLLIDEPYNSFVILDNGLIVTKNLSDKTPATRGSLHVVVDAKANKLYLKKGLKLLWQADCSVGRGGTLVDAKTGRRWEFVTPRGEFRVIGKAENPEWVKPDWAFVEAKEPIPPPEDPSRKVPGELGAYVLNLGDGYLIHGTLHEELLGRPASHGCVRLAAADLKKLYETVPVNTRVYIY